MIKTFDYCALTLGYGFILQQDGAENEKTTKDLFAMDDHKVSLYSIQFKGSGGAVDNFKKLLAEKEFVEVCIELSIPEG